MSCENTDSGKRNHGIPAPVLKKGEAGQNGFPAGGFPGGNKLIRAFYKETCNIGFQAAFFLQFFPVSLQSADDFLRALRPRLHFIYDFQHSGLPGSHIQGENMIGQGAACFPSAVAGIIAVMIAFLLINLCDESICAEVKGQAGAFQLCARPAQLLRLFHIASLGNKLEKGGNLQPA